MKFLEDGADIPDQLLHAVNNGDSVFLCGAGVSLSVGMPSFCNLTKCVYRKMDETCNNEPAERIAFERKEYDRVLRFLENRTHLPKTESRVRAIVAETLTAPDDVSAPNHLVLLQLLRDNEGRVLSRQVDFGFILLSEIEIYNHIKR